MNAPSTRRWNARFSATRRCLCEDRHSRFGDARRSLHSPVADPHLLANPGDLLPLEMDLEELAAHDGLAFAVGLVGPPGDDLLRGRVEHLSRVAPAVFTVAAETDPAVRLRGHRRHLLELRRHHRIVEDVHLLVLLIDNPDLLLVRS